MNQLPENPLVSIIMPVYDAGDFFIPAVESILSQSYQNFELLVCIDGSPDKSMIGIQNVENERIIINLNIQNQGYLKTCNDLFGKAKGDIITFQDADDWSEPERLQLIVDTFKENPEAGVSLSYYKKVNEKGKLIEEKDSDFNFDAYANDAKYWEYFCGSSIAMRREVLEKVGGYHPYFDRKGGEDYDWLFRICKQFKGVQIKQSLYNYRIHDSAVKKQDRLERYYIMDLINEGRKLMITEDKDYLASKNEDWLKEKVRYLELPFKHDSSLILRKKAIGKLNSKRYGAALAMAVGAFWHKPVEPVNWFFSLYVIYLMIRRVIKL